MWQRTHNSFFPIHQEIFEYINYFTDIKNKLSKKYGDEDDGKVVFFSSDIHCNFKSLAFFYSIIFKDEKYKFKSAGFDLKRLLFGNSHAF
jgi:hypothetical protein